MTSAYRTVLFDLGNTLFYDRAADWPRVYARAEKALWEVLREGGIGIGPTDLYGGPGTLLGHYYAHRGQGLEEQSTVRYLGNLLATHRIELPEATMHGALRAMYRETQRNWRRERGAVSTLRTLRGRNLRLGVVSNVSDELNALELLDRARLRQYFEHVVTSAAHGRRKPDPSIFEAALNGLDADPRQTVMIGDSYEADILGGDRLGMFTIWLTRRVRPRTLQQPMRADAIANNLGEIPKLLA